MIRRRETADRYFSVYLGYPVSQVKPGEVVPVSCKRRLKPEVGWGYAVALWVQIFRGRAVISVRPDLFGALKRMLTERPTPRQLLTVQWRKKMSSLVGSEKAGGLSHVLYCEPGHLRSFRILGCRRLRMSDVDRYLKMSFKLTQTANPSVWQGILNETSRKASPSGFLKRGNWHPPPKLLPSVPCKMLLRRWAWILFRGIRAEAMVKP